MLVSLYTSVPENPEEVSKRKKIEEALKNNNTALEEWKEFAISDYGLINGGYYKIMHHEMMDGSSSFPWIGNNIFHYH